MTVVTAGAAASGDRARTTRSTGSPRSPNASPKKAAKLERVAERHQQAAAKLAEKARSARAIAREQLAALDLWTRKAPATRRPRFTREEIADAAMRIADAEGFDAVSMRRIATELEAGTMTLYHYVRTKDELLSLVVDAVMGEIVVPTNEAFPTDWRARDDDHRRTQSRARCVRHPWILDITDDPPVGPNTRPPLRPVAAGGRVAADHARREARHRRRGRRVRVRLLPARAQHDLQNDAHPFDDDMIDYVNELIATGDYPQLAALTAEHGVEETWAELDRHFRDPGRFERGLTRLLDGFAASLRDNP